MQQHSTAKADYALIMYLIGSAGLLALVFIAGGAPANAGSLEPFTVSPVVANAAIEPIEIVSISQSLTLSDDLGLNFIVNEGSDENYYRLTVKLTGNCAENGQTLPIRKKTIGGQECYCVTASVSAKNSGDTITAEVFADGGTTAIGSAESSVSTYLNSVKNQTTSI